MTDKNFNPDPMPKDIKLYREKVWYSLQWLVKYNELQNGKLTNHEKDIKWLQRFVYMGIGGSATITIVLRVVGII